VASAAPIHDAGPSSPSAGNAVRTDLWGDGGAIGAAFSQPASVIAPATARVATSRNVGWKEARRNPVIIWTVGRAVNRRLPDQR